MTTMTTLLKIEANRDNALASTGPRTAEGRAIVSGNAIRHGLLSWKPVIPGLENPEDWQTHLDRTLDSLAPVGYMETLLAERVALLLWRLGRVARYEGEAVAIAAETAEAGWTRYRAGEQFVVNARRRESPLVEANRKLQTAKEDVELGHRLKELPQTEPIDPETAARLVKACADLAQVALDDDDLEFPDYPDGAALDEVEWTAGQLIKAINAIAAYHPGSKGDLLGAATHKARLRLKKAEQEKAELEQEFSCYRRKQLIPDGVTSDRVNRYETTLERSLFRALHELERRQAARDGQTVPLPVAVDVNLSSPAEA
jgi:hypothetical protein